MFHTLGVALCCLVGACPIFVAGTGCEISSPYIDKPGQFSIACPVSSVHVRIVHQLPFVLGFIPSHIYTLILVISF